MAKMQNFTHWLHIDCLYFKIAYAKALLLISVLEYCLITDTNFLDCKNVKGFMLSSEFFRCLLWNNEKIGTI